MTVSHAMNADLSQRAVMHAGSMAWQASPSRTVWRKRLHLVGSSEAGRVTSLVRYEPNASFPAHAHPDGEEILVLEGTFSDERGDWPAGTYLLSPEGFRHAPFSKPGCVLFVKLRQYAGPGRRCVVLRTPELAWQTTGLSGIERKLLYAQAGFADTVELQRWAPATCPGTIRYEGGAELFVLSGGFEDEYGAYERHAWLRLPAGAGHTPVSPGGCELYVKTGGLVAAGQHSEERAP